MEHVCAECRRSSAWPLALDPFCSESCRAAFEMRNPVSGATDGLRSPFEIDEVIVPGHKMTVHSTRRAYMEEIYLRCECGVEMVFDGPTPWELMRAQSQHLGDVIEWLTDHADLLDRLEGGQ